MLSRSPDAKGGTLGYGTPGVTSKLPLEVNFLQTFNPKPKPKTKLGW